MCIINTFLFLANDLSTVTSHAGPIDLSRGSTLEISEPLFPNQEQGFEKVGATTASSEETENKPQSICGTDYLNGEKSRVENSEKSKKKRRKVIQYEAVQEKTKKG